MLPQAKEVLGDDRLMELGEQMTQRKKELTKQFKEMNGSARKAAMAGTGAGARSRGG
jgi:hypothetical protein